MLQAIEFPVHARGQVFRQAGRGYQVIGKPHDELARPIACHYGLRQSLFMIWVATARETDRYVTTNVDATEEILRRCYDPPC